jgi:hypothetical protein
MHGFGKYTSNLGSIYEGSFENDTADGKGVLTYSNGTRFEGNWSSSKMRDGKMFYFETQKIYDASCTGGDDIVDGFRVYNIALREESDGTVFREGTFTNGRFI